MSDSKLNARQSLLTAAIGMAIGLTAPAAVFGQQNGVLELSELDGSNGFVLNGVAASDFSGFSVSSAGDFNGDGIDDLVVGAAVADSNGYDSGATYVVFGTIDPRSAAVELSALDGTDGIVINGVSPGDFSGNAVGSGDFNGDGVDDLVIGAYRAIGNGERSGASFVVFGSRTGFDSPLELSSLDGSNGFRIIGAAASDMLGSSVNSSGDFNGDGIDDLLLGASYADASYIVFGREGSRPDTLSLSSLNGSNGFVISGAGVGDFRGSPVAAAGDVNGDGIDDVIVGAFGADFNGYDSGSAYVVFGSTTGLLNPFNLSSLDGTNGFAINGVAAGDLAGTSVSGGGDINGDGLDDLIVSATGVDSNGDYSGATYVVFGSQTGFADPLELSTLDGSNGFVINGVTENDRAGQSVSAGGDLNGDGIDDLIIGANGAAPNGSGSGATYVVFGSNQGLPDTLELSTLDGSNGYTVNGVAGGDNAGFAVRVAGDVNGDSNTDFLIGAPFASPNVGGSGATYVVFGTSPFIFSDGFEESE